MNQIGIRGVETHVGGRWKMFDRRGWITAWLCVLAMAVLAAIVILAAGAVSAHAADDKTPEVRRSLIVGGFERTFLVHVPARFDFAAAARDRKPLPVVIVLHGAGGDGAEVERQTGFGQLADKEDFLAVFPDALPALPNQPAAFLKNPRFWSDGAKRGSEQHRQIDDVAFLTAVLDDVEKSYPAADPNRVYVTGFSSGGSMTFHAAASAFGQRIAAAAPVSGHFFPVGPPHDGRPTPVVFIIGTKDPLNPLDGGAAPSPWNPNAVSPKLSDTVSAWAKVVGCPDKPAEISDEHGVRRMAYGPGKDGVEFLVWTVDGLGHRWPGSKTETLPDRIVGPGSDKLDATTSIWKFLSRHTLSVRAEAP